MGGSWHRGLGGLGSPLPEDLRAGVPQPVGRVSGELLTRCLCPVSRASLLRPLAACGLLRRLLALPEQGRLHLIHLTKGRQAESALYDFLHRVFLVRGFPTNGGGVCVFKENKNGSVP